MTENTSTALTSIDAEEAAIESVLARTGDDPIAILKEAYATAQAAERRHTRTMQDADLARKQAMVWQARVAYRTASLEGIVTSRYPYNITGAARALGVPVATLRPYALAGQALHKADKAGLLSAPGKEDIAIVDGSFDATSRADQKAKRELDKKKKAALEAKALELEALKKANGSGVADVQAAADAVIAAGQADKATNGTQAPAAAAAAPTGQQAPAQAQAGPSLEDDILTTAKQLVAQVKRLRADKGWAKIAPKVVAILGEAFPVLSK